MSGVRRRIGYLFVYGTLRPALRHSLQQALRKHAQWIGGGQTSGLLYDIGQYPALVPGINAGIVYGDVYRLRHARILLRMLDDYEACSPRMPQPREYRRVPLVVQCRGRRVWAWVYVYNRSVHGLKLLAGGDYPKQINNSARSVVSANHRYSRSARRQ